jgi:hypothetical protein
MTRTTLLVGLCALAVAAMAAGTGSGAPAQTRPLLGVAATSPLELRGSGFVPQERVQVLLAAGGRQLSRSAVASPAGAFRVVFQVSVGRCGRFTARAFGARGSHARIVQRRRLPDCVPPTGTGPST